MTVTPSYHATECGWTHTSHGDAFRTHDVHCAAHPDCLPNIMMWTSFVPFSEAQLARIRDGRSPEVLRRDIDRFWREHGRNHTCPTHTR